MKETNKQTNKQTKDHCKRNSTLQRVCVLRKLNGVGLLSEGNSSARERSTESFTILGGVPVLSLPILSPSLSLNVWDNPALDGASPIRPPGDDVWPMKREPDRNVPVVRTTELAEMGWLPFAEKMSTEMDNYKRITLLLLIASLY